MKVFRLPGRQRRHKSDGTVDLPDHGLMGLEIRTDVKRRKELPKEATHYVELPVDDRSPDLGWWTETEVHTPRRTRGTFDPFHWNGGR